MYYELREYIIMVRSRREQDPIQAAALAAEWDNKLAVLEAEDEARKEANDRAEVVAAIVKVLDGSVQPEEAVKLADRFLSDTKELTFEQIPVGDLEDVTSQTLDSEQAEIARQEAIEQARIAAIQTAGDQYYDSL